MSREGYKGKTWLGFPHVPCYFPVFSSTVISWNRAWSFVLNLFSFLLLSFFVSRVPSKNSWYIFLSNTGSYRKKNDSSSVYHIYHSHRFIIAYTYFLCRNMWNSEWSSIILWMPECHDSCHFPLQCNQCYSKQLSSFPFPASPNAGSVPLYTSMYFDSGLFCLKAGF